MLIAGASTFHFGAKIWKQVRMLDPVFNRTLFAITCARSHVEGGKGGAKQNEGKVDSSCLCTEIKIQDSRFKAWSRLKPNAGSILG